MAFEIIGNDGAYHSVRVSGIMKLADMQGLQSAGMKVIGQGKTLRLLVILENFQGWEKGVDWGDVGFLMDHGDNIAKIAIVGEEQWKIQIFAFVGKGLRPTEIEFFPPSRRQEAENWVHA